MDDLTLGEMLTQAYRGQVDYCVPGGMSVSQSSSSAMFDGSGQPDVTLNVIEAHNSLSEDIRIEQTHDRSGQPDERNSSKAQIRTLLEEQRQTIIAEYREKVSHHELQAAHADDVFNSPTNCDHLPVSDCAFPIWAPDGKKGEGWHSQVGPDPVLQIHSPGN